MNVRTDRGQFSTLGLAAGAWLGAGVLAQLALFILETTARGNLCRLGLRGWGAAASLALGFALAGTAAIGALHLVHYIAKRRRERAAVPASLAGALLAGAWLGHDQARFLTSGDGISGSPHVFAIQVGLTVVLALATGGLWVWHLLGARPDTVPTRLNHRSLLTSLVWAGSGALGALTLAYLIATRLDFYLPFAQFLMGPCWVFVATLCHRAIAPRTHGRIALTGALIAVSGLSLLGSRAGLDRVSASGKLAAYTELLDPIPEKPVTTFRIETAALDPNEACRSIVPERARSPLTIPRARRRNVIVISIDALRADALDLVINGRPVMPNLHAFARDSVVFTRAQTSYPATIYALGGATTGLAPSQLLYAPQVPANFVRRANGAVARRVVVFARNEWFELPIIERLLVQDATLVRAKNDAVPMTDALLAELSAARPAGESTLAWIHYLDLHQPFHRHRNFDFGGGSRNRYLSEAAYVDAQLGRVFGALEAGGWYEDSLVLVFSDHGEALGERSYVGHHVYLNRWIADVPLLLRAPGVAARRIQRTVSLIDVAPTVEHFLDLRSPPLAIGRSLFSSIGAGDEARADFVVAEAFPVRGRQLFSLANRPIQSRGDLEARLLATQNKRGAQAYEPKVSIVNNRYRLIISRTTGARVLYDRFSDPNETHDLSDTLPLEVEALTGALAEWHRDVSARILCDVAGDRSVGPR